MSKQFFMESLDDIEDLIQDAKPGYLERVQTLLAERADGLRHDISTEREVFLTLRTAAKEYSRDLQKTLDLLAAVKKGFFEHHVDAKGILTLLDDALIQGSTAVDAARKIEQLTVKEEEEVS